MCIICETTELHKLDLKDHMSRMYDKLSAKLAWNYELKGCHAIGRKFNGAGMGLVLAVYSDDKLV